MTDFRRKSRRKSRHCTRYRNINTYKKQYSFDKFPNKLHLSSCINDFASFVPNIVHKHILNNTKKGTGKQLKPVWEKLYGAFLFVDICGFTNLTNILSKHKNGAKILCDILNDYFDILIKIVSTWDGDIIRFVGDAVLISWPVHNTNNHYIDLQKIACLKATLCSIDLHKYLDNYQSRSGITLSLHIGMSAGYVTSMHAGGILDRWEYLQFGPPLDDIGVAVSSATAGETIVSSYMWNIIKDLDNQHGYLFDNDLCGKNVIRKLKYTKDQSCIVTDKHLRAIQQYIPFAIHTKLARGRHNDLCKTIEVSCVFLKVITGIEVNHNPIIAHNILQTFQKCIYKLQGSLNKFVVDDKGTIAMAIFGIDGYHHDNPSRALEASINTIKSLANIGIESQCGVTTGKVFAGIVGNSDRKEFTVIGDSINTASRLMMNANPGTVLCNIDTYKRTNNDFNFFRISGKYLNKNIEQAFMPYEKIY